MRKVLDRLYDLSGGLAACLIALICLVVTLQVLFNLITKVVGTSINLTIPSYADFTGYFLAASSFLALAYTLTRGGHIRVTLFIGKATGRRRLTAEVLSLALSAGISLYATYFLARLTSDSFKFGDVSPGIVAIPLWVPQSVVTLGLAIFSIALVDLLVRTVRSAAPVIEQQDTP